MTDEPTRDSAEVETCVATLLRALGATEDLDEELADTPRRFAALLQSYFRPGGERIRLAAMPIGHRAGPVMVRDLPFHALCVHHIVPFFGHIHIYYEPRDHIVGFGALGRLVDSLCRRPQLQERLVEQIAEAIWDDLTPHRVVVASEARQMCMELSGARKSGGTVCVAQRPLAPDAGDPWQVATSMLRQVR